MPTKPSPSTQDPNALPTLLYFEMCVCNLSAEGYTLRKGTAKMPALVIDQYIMTNSCIDSSNKIHQKMTLGSQQGGGCDVQAAKPGIRDSGSQAVFEIFSAIHYKIWGTVCLPSLCFRTPINIMEIILNCIVGLR